MTARLKIYFDGGYRPGGGGMETAVVVRGQAHIQPDLGEGTSMTAEWLALLQALRLVRTLGETNVVLLGDAVAVIDRANGVLKARGACLPHLTAVRDLTAALGSPPIRYVKRAQNLAGIALSRRHPR
ncbi:reverse transcriptase-like protein [Sphingomonas mollis]|uniref:Reverse transcriptase-like protein n=1 Tax=Sphingomonas mollis TaxID=2795726 RepID=A0ABS0XRI8_9SPHN|nr:reverse transcriptase-like protein [Sphingomonas sp. BT553]MBJ6122343.1 reverse transcriptase-like protein [Sphingomonas sp. BT553]